MPDSATASNCNRLRKKRPERQLYVPPAQRLLKENSPQNNGNEDKTKIVNKKKKSIGIEVNKQNVTKEFRTKENIENDMKIEFRKETEKLLNYQKCTKSTETEQNISYIHISWEYRISKSTSDIHCKSFCETKCYPFIKYCHYPSIYKKIPIYIYNKSSSNVLYVLYKDYALWQPKIYVNYIKSDKNSVHSRAYPLYSFDESFRLNNLDFQEKVSSVIYNVEIVYEKVISNFDISECRAFKVLWNASQCYPSKNDIIDLSDLKYGHIFIIHNENERDYIYECKEDHDILECYLDKLGKVSNVTLDTEVGQNNTKSARSDIIVLEERSKSSGKNEATVQENNIKNSTPNLYMSSDDLIKNMNFNKIIKSKRSNEHEQEKEIMRKTKKYVNRKTRPIIKYVDNASDELQIGKGDNVTDWEDLFEDDERLQEKLFKKIDYEVETDISGVNNEEYYSDSAPKRSEDLDHMVEVYDFPPSFGTHDIIQAFSDINSDAMYVKWVDDTHAILVLGSLKQAQRAVELNNSLIKVRPMTAASSVCLAMAYKNDLKPAMKRPQTNLQTARRLITTHLGTKSRVSQEQNAKERNDLKAARELKKLTRKNEQDAWEGKLRSSVN